jgi:DNA-binding NarL/FixJ family response regulator
MIESGGPVARDAMWRGLDRIRLGRDSLPNQQPRKGHVGEKKSRQSVPLKQPTTGRPRVVLADTHRLVVEGLVSLLSPVCDIVGTVEDGRALVDAVRRLRPDIVVSDISLPVLNGIDAMAQLKKQGTKAKVIFLTMHRDAAYAVRAMDAGASGFVLKHSASSELLTAIHDVLEHKTYVTPLLPSHIFQHRKSPQSQTRDAASLLTPRQREVLRLVAQGLTAKEIGEALDISPRTVEFHRNKIKGELALHNQSELVQFALKHGIAMALMWLGAMGLGDHLTGG